MKLIVLKRKRGLKGGRGIISVLSVTIGILLFTSVLVFLGKDPFEIFSTIFLSFLSPTVVMDMLILTMLGYALLLSFKASVWNIGAEGQFHIAMIPVVYLLIVKYPEPPLTSFLMILLSIILAGIAGGLWSLIAGFLKSYMKLDEVPVTLILNYIAYYIVNYLVYGPFRGRYVYGYARTDDLREYYSLSVYWTLKVYEGIQGVLTRLISEVVQYFYWLITAILIALLVWFIFSKTTLGLKLRALSSNPDFLITTGVDIRKYYMIVFFISGALVGITGALYLLGYSKRLSYPIEAQTAGYGYLAVLVVWLALLE